MPVHLDPGDPSVMIDALLTAPRTARILSVATLLFAMTLGTYASDLAYLKAPSDVAKKTACLQQEAFPEITRNARSIESPPMPTHGLEPPARTGPGGGGPGEGR